MTDFLSELSELKDEKNALFQAKLTPGIPLENFLGVRVPDCRNLAKRLYREQKEKVDQFQSNLPHKYFDQNMLHGLLIEQEKDFDICINKLEKFFPFIDNWAVCDSMSPKVLKKDKGALLEKILVWSRSPHVYTCRFGLEMLMRDFLNGDFRKEYLEIPAAVKSDEYYVNMMIAWFFATALTKQWKDTIIYIEEKRLGEWVHNKTIQKARESFRITPEQKEYLKSLKR